MGRICVVNRPCRYLFGCALGWLASTSVVSAENCVKVVLDRLCLGGDFQNLVRQMPAPPLYRYDDAERNGVIYAEGSYQLYVMAFRQQIYKVVRKYPSQSMLEFNELKIQLEGKYGSPHNGSRLPEYAANPAAQIGAIRRGDGRLEYRWNQPDNWYIELSWSQELGIALAYVVTDISEAQAAAMARGY